MANKQQITGKGIAQQSGLEIYRSITTYTGEYVNWGNALAYGTQLGSDTTAIISGDVPDAQFTALTDNPPTNTNQWFRYYTTTGTNHYVTTPPTSGSGFFTFNGASSGGKQSYSGIYQKLSLETGSQYQIDITNTIDSDTGVLYVATYYARFHPSLNKVAYKQGSVASVTYPLTSTSTCILSSVFTAVSQEDIVVIYFTTTAASASVNITDIKIRQKEEFLMPIYCQDIYGGAEKVLRKKIQNERINTD